MTHRLPPAIAAIAVAAAVGGCTRHSTSPDTTSTTRPPAATTTTSPAQPDATEATDAVPEPLSKRRPAIRTDPAQLARRYAAEYFAGVPINRLIELATDDYAKALFTGADDDTRRALRVAADPAIDTGRNIWVVTLTTWTGPEDTSPDTRVAAVTVAADGDQWRVAGLAVEL